MCKAVGVRDSILSHFIDKHCYLRLQGTPFASVDDQEFQDAVAARNRAYVCCGLEFDTGPDFSVHMEVAHTVRIPGSVVCVLRPRQSV